jgi:hypothetical protein
LTRLRWEDVMRRTKAARYDGAEPLRTAEEMAA